METNGQPSPPPAVEHPSLNTAILVLNIVGCILLSILVVTMSLSHRLPRRDPVVNNFLYTWIWLSALAAFDELTLIAKQEVGSATSVRESVLILVTMVSTFNLSLHLWYIMRSAFHQWSAKRISLRTLMLVITPYIIGLIPLITLFNSVGEVITGLFFLAFAVLNPGIDSEIDNFILLIYYWRWYRKTRKANMTRLMSLSFLVRLLAFSIYQSVYSILFFMGTASPKVIWSEFFHLSKIHFLSLPSVSLACTRTYLEYGFRVYSERSARRATNRRRDRSRRIAMTKLRLKVPKRRTKTFSISLLEWTRIYVVTCSLTHPRLKRGKTVTLKATIICLDGLKHDDGIFIYDKKRHLPFNGVWLTVEKFL